MINVALFGLGRIGMMHAKNILDHKYLKPRGPELPTQMEYLHLGHETESKLMMDLEAPFLHDLRPNSMLNL